MIADEKGSNSSDSGSEHDLDEEDSNKAWRYILREAWQDMEEKPENITQLINEPYIAEYLDHIHDNVNYFKWLHGAITNSEIGKKLDYSFTMLIKDGYDTEEADETAWHARRFLLKRLVNENLDTLDEPETDEELEDDNSDE